MKARKYLLNMGYNVDEDIYSNYNTLDKRDEKEDSFLILKYLKSQEYCDTIILDPSTAFAPSAFEDKVIKIWLNLFDCVDVL